MLAEAMDQRSEHQIFSYLYSKKNVISDVIVNDRSNRNLDEIHSVFRQHFSSLLGSNYETMVDAHWDRLCPEGQVNRVLDQ